MLWVVTLSLFLPSFTSSWLVCANPSAGQEPSNAAHSKIFFMIGLPRLKFMTPKFDCAGDRLPHYTKGHIHSRAAPLGPSFGVNAAVKRRRSMRAGPSSPRQGHARARGRGPWDSP